MFDGSGSVKRFLFVFENVIAREKSEEDRDLDIISHLGGKVFEAYFDHFNPTGELTKSGKNHQEIR